MLPLAHIQSLADALGDALRTSPGDVALIEIDRRVELRRMTYRDVFVESARVARSFAPLLPAAGAFDGRLAAIVMSNQSRWLTTATGAFFAGATLVPVDHKLRPDEQAGVLRHAKPRIIVTEWHVWRELRPHVDELGAHVFVTGCPDGVEPEGAHRWPGDACPADDGAALDSATLPEVPRPSRGDVACVVYSSGTSGDVKGCMLTHGNYLAQAESLGRLYPMKSDEVYFSILPTNHAIDFMCGYLMPLMFGATVLHQRTLRPEYLRYGMQRYAVTHIAVVPLLLRAFQERLEERFDGQSPARRALVDGLVRTNEALTLRRPLPWLSRALLKPVHDGFGGRLQFIFAGGAFVEPGMAEYFYRLGLPIVIGYGLTEAGTVLTVNDLCPFRPDTVGPPVDGVELQIRDADATGAGEVWARGPTIMRGYFRNDALTRDTIVDGWLRTGDVGWIDPAGHLHLVGRRRNMIVTAGGKNVYPEDVEAAFDGVDGVEELCVFAADYVWPRAERSLTGETLLVAVRLRDGAALDDVAAALAARNRRLADYKRVTSLLATTEPFPRTASMKVRRDPLAALLRAGTTREDATPLATEAP